MSIKRGDIYYIIDKNTATGSEMCAGRPAIIVSNDICNEKSPVVEVVFLTTRPKTSMPTHVNINSTVRASIALCEQITSVAIERVGDRTGSCTEVEMASVDKALRVSLALNNPTLTERHQTIVSETNDAILTDLRTQLAQALAERDHFKNMYDSLVDKLLDRR